MKILTKKEKLKRYKEVLKFVIDNPNTQCFLCTLLLNHYDNLDESLNMGYPSTRGEFIKKFEKDFNEFFLFREQETECWLSDQLDDNCVETSSQVNEIRVFILQLCIEMIK